MIIFFFFQAEDGIRDVAVTGVQTCALPICAAAGGDVVVEEGEHRVGHGRVARHDTIGGRRRTTRASTTCQTMKRASPSATQAPAARQRTGSASNKASRPSAVASPT